jgi:hypothetical protein
MSWSNFCRIKNRFSCVIIAFLKCDSWFASIRFLLDLQASDVLLNQKSQIDISTYLGIEHSILIGRDYKKSYDYIEELINRKVYFLPWQQTNSIETTIVIFDKKFEMTQVLRLMVLLSITNNGLLPTDYNQLKTLFLQVSRFSKKVRSIYKVIGIRIYPKIA